MDSQNENEYYDENQDDELIISNDEIAEVIDQEEDIPEAEDNDMEMDTMDTDDEEDEDEVVENDSEVRFSMHTGSIFSVALNPKHECYALTGGEDDRGFIWDITNGEPYAELRGHSDSVVSVGFNVTGEYAATGGMDGIIKIWDVMNQGKFIIDLDGPSEINWLSWHPKGNIIIAGSSDATIWMWMVPSGKFMNSFSGHQESVSCGTFTPDGKNILSGSNDGSMILWDPRSGSPIYTIKPTNTKWHDNPITSIAINKDNTVVLSGSSGGSLCLSQLHTGKVITSLEGHVDSIEDVGFCDCLPLMASASLDGTVRVWDLNNYRIRHVLNHDGPVIKLKFHKNSPLFTTCSFDKTIRMWDARTGECKKVWKGHKKGILDFAMTNDGSVIVTAGDDKESLVFMIDE